MKTSLVGIDVLRFFAAAIVMVFHLAFWSWLPAEEDSTTRAISGGTYQYPELTTLSSAMWVGVEIFFVISGFVIVYSANGTAWDFLKRRALRLYPCVWIIAPLSALLLLLCATYSPGDILLRLLRSLVLWPKGPWVDGVYWTLPVEIAFYAVIFMVLLMHQKRHLVALLCVLGCVSTLFWLAASFGPLADALVPYVFDRRVLLTLLPHGCFFAVGGLLWAILCNGASRHLWLVVALCSVGGLIEISHKGAPRAELIDSPASIHLAWALWILSLAMMVASVRFASALSGVLSAKWIRSVGLATYPLYLVHNILGAVVLAVCAAIGLGRWSALGIAMLLPIGFSFAVLVLEPPLRTVLARALEARIFGRRWRVAEPAD